MKANSNTCVILKTPQITEHKVIPISHIKEESLGDVPDEFFHDILKHEMSPIKFEKDIIPEQKISNNVTSLSKKKEFKKAQDFLVNNVSEDIKQSIQIGSKQVCYQKRKAFHSLEHSIPKWKCDKSNYSSAKKHIEKLTERAPDTESPRQLSKRRRYRNRKKDGKTKSKWLHSDYPVNDHKPIVNQHYSDKRKRIDILGPIKDEIKETETDFARVRLNYFIDKQTEDYTVDDVQYNNNPNPCRKYEHGEKSFPTKTDVNDLYSRREFKQETGLYSYELSQNSIENTTSIKPTLKLENINISLNKPQQLAVYKFINLMQDPSTESLSETILGEKLVQIYKNKQWQ